jgi:2-deoxy-D-gluconate 3-dehydrogenase
MGALRGLALIGAMSRLFDLTGRVAVVTGGNGGIGLAMAEGLAEAGARVIISGRRQDKARTALARLDAVGGEALFIAADIGAGAACCEALMSEALKRCGRIDILVNNAGMNIRKRPEALTADDWRAVLDVNLTGAFHCAQAVYPAMTRQGGGKIINVASIYAQFGAPLVAAYAASKGGLVQLTRSLAAAWAPQNVQVNAVLPGWIDTELTTAAREQIPELNEMVLGRTPAGRWGKPADLAGIAIFLAAPASDFVTGAALPVDGGYGARG